MLSLSCLVRVASNATMAPENIRVLLWSALV
jgi:hypothetical protein